jgi:8-oxo-dGTP pyrophosphatase MutT (NUDIX family)
MSSTQVDSIERVRQELLRLAHGPLPRPVAGGIVVARGARLAMILGGSRAAGWNFPKGGIDEGETSLQAALKETGEEAGLEALPVDVPPMSIEARVFRDTLGFGSPRGSKPAIYHPRCQYFGEWRAILQAAPAGSQISLGAVRLLEQAATAASVTDFAAVKELLFDALRGEKIRWQQMPTFHVLAFVAYRPERLTGESTAVRWWTVEELLHAIDFGGNVSKQVRQLLPPEKREAFAEAVRIAAAQANSGDQSWTSASSN